MTNGNFVRVMFRLYTSGLILLLYYTVKEGGGHHRKYKPSDFAVSAVLNY